MGAENGGTLMEYRLAPEIRAPSDEGVITLQVVTFGQPDEYGTEWMPGVFTDFLERSRPTFFYGHAGAADLRNVLGHGKDWHETDVGYTIDFALDDFEAVPAARQAHAQAKSGTLRWASVGFERKEWKTIEDSERPALHEQMIKADLPEVSILSIPGAVQGAGVVGVRRPPLRVRSAADGLVSVDLVTQLALKMKSGELTLTEALEQIREAAAGAVIPPQAGLEPAVGTESDDQPPEASDTQEATDELLEALGADMAEALKLAGRTVRRPLEVRGAIGVHSTAVRDDAWDGPAATAAMPNDAAVLRYCHAWYAGSSPDQKGSYKMPHHRTEGGPAIVAAVRNGLARLPQSNIPMADHAGVERHLRRHLDDFNK